MILQNTRNYLPSDTVFHPIKLESDLNDLTFDVSGSVSKHKGKTVLPFRSFSKHDNV